MSVINTREEIRLLALINDLEISGLVVSILMLIGKNAVRKLTHCPEGLSRNSKQDWFSALCY